MLKRKGFFISISQIVYGIRPLDISITIGLLPLTLNSDSTLENIDIRIFCC